MTKPATDIVIKTRWVRSRCGVCAVRIVADVGEAAERVVGPPWHCEKHRAHWIANLQTNIDTGDPEPERTHLTDSPNA